MTVFTGNFLSTSQLGRGIVEICLDRKNEAVNKLDPLVIAELARMLTPLAQDGNLRGVLVTSAKDAFLAGADIQALWTLLGGSRKAQIAFCADADRVLTQLEDLPVPVVCAINGYALGGGLETALCADYRVLAADGQVGFPEVGFGILPGAGGTVRAPRLTNAATALHWIVGARTFKADAALKAGMVDAVAEPTRLRATALDWLQQAIDDRLDWKTRRELRKGVFASDEAAFATARSDAQKSVHHYPARLAVVDLLQRCAPLSRDAALPLEAEIFSTLAQTPTAKAMVGIFLANQQLKKRNKELASRARPAKRTAILGAGIMGGGIAYTTAVKGMQVLLKDIAQSALDLGVSEARKLLAKQVEGGRLTPSEAEAIQSAITPTLEFQGFDTVDIVVEAVVENLKVKQEVLARVESLARPDTVLVSNTSSLPIAEIAAELRRPENVAGMHFFNPVHVMQLVEVVRSAKTSDATIATTVAYALAMGRTPLVVKDCPGFLVNRVLGAYFTAFALLIRDGADFMQIERVMESWGWPMGPAYLFDVAGLDTIDKALRILAAAYPGVMATDFRTVIQILAEEKRYGQKSGAGFFRYEADPKGKPRRSGDPSIAGLIARAQPTGARAFADDDILDRMMLAMTLEAGRCLDEQIAESAIDIDASMRLGTGFPAHHGGPLWYADSLGLAEVLNRCARYRSLGGLYAPGHGLRQLADRNRTFYGANLP